MTSEYTKQNPGYMISDNAGYQVFSSVYKVEAVPDTYCVELYSVHKQAANPDEQRSITCMMLSEKQLLAFQASLGVPNAVR